MYYCIKSEVENVHGKDSHSVKKVKPANLF